MYLYQAGFRDGTPGLILAGLYAAQTLAKYAKLWEYRLKKNSRFREWPEDRPAPPPDAPR
jgi:hypothetical protein